MGEIAINPIHNVHKKYREMNLVNPYVFAASTPPISPFVVSYYKFDNNSLDTKSINNATAVNLTYGSGLVGQKGIFNGSSAYLSIADSDSLSFCTPTSDLPFSLSFIVNFNVLTSGSRIWILSKRGGGTQIEYQVSIYDGVYFFDLYDITNQAYIRNQFSATANFNTTGNFIVTNTYNGTGLNGLKTYINGVLVAATKTAIGSYARMRNSANTMLIGRNEGGFYLNGSLDEIAIFNKELNQSEITAVNNTHLSGQSLI